MWDYIFLEEGSVCRKLYEQKYCLCTVFINKIKVCYEGQSKVGTDYVVSCLWIIVINQSLLTFTDFECAMFVSVRDV